MSGLRIGTTRTVGYDPRHRCVIRALGPPLTNLRGWFSADSGTGAVNDGDAITTWTDRRGNANLSGTATWKSAAGPGSKPCVRFNGTSNDLTVTFAFWTTAADLFIVIKANADPAATAAKSGIWGAGGSGFASRYPFTDGSIYDDAASTTQRTWNPTPALNDWRLYNVSSQNASWIASIDGTASFSDGTNTVTGTPSPLRIGGYGGSVFLDGDIAEVLIYNAILPAGDKSSVHSYLRRKYSLSIA